MTYNTSSQTSKPRQKGAMHLKLSNNSGSTKVIDEYRAGQRTTEIGQIDAEIPGSNTEDINSNATGIFSPSVMKSSINRPKKSIESKVTTK